MKLSVFALALILFCSIASAPGFTAETESDFTIESVPLRHRPFSLLLGYGYEFGGFGFGGEWQFTHSHRYAVLAGYGFHDLWSPEFRHYVQVSSWSCGIRRHFDGGKHRFFAQTLFCPIAWEGIPYRSDGTYRLDVSKTYYGGTLGLGYRHIADGGFTVSLGGGMIWRPYSGIILGQTYLSLGYSF